MGRGCRWGLTAAMGALRARLRLPLRGPIRKGSGHAQSVRSRIPWNRGSERRAGRTGTGAVRSRDYLDASGGNSPMKSARTPRRDGQARSAPAWRRDHVSGPGATDRLGLEIAADLADATSRDIATQVAEAIKPSEDLLLITGAHIW